MFSTHFQAVAVDCPSVFHCENCKKLPKREFRSDPVYTSPVRNFPNDGASVQQNLPPPRLGEAKVPRKTPLLRSKLAIAFKTLPLLNWNGQF